jgi:hypothetical protein
MNVPYLHPRLPDSLKWRILGALLKLNQPPHTAKTRSVILGALGAMNIAAANGVPGGREAIVANLLVGLEPSFGSTLRPLVVIPAEAVERLIQLDSASVPETGMPGIRSSAESKIGALGELHEIWAASRCKPLPFTLL